MPRKDANTHGMAMIICKKDKGEGVKVPIPGSIACIALNADIMTYSDSACVWFAPGKYGCEWVVLHLLKRCVCTKKAFPA